MASSSSTTSKSKEEQKELDKAEAKRRGISYKEVRHERRQRQREAEALETKEHKTEVKRLRSYSTDEPNENKRRRTRSMDAAEEKEAASKASLTPQEWRKEHNITVRGHGNESGTKEFPDPFQEFSQTPFERRIQQSFKTAGFERPSSIQGQAWPIALQNKDMICIAKTGSGKTCGFLLPVFHQHLSSGKMAQGYCKPVLLVLAPTRELSVQIMEETVKFGRPIGIRSVCCYGGSSKYPQIAALSRGVECIIATPGRLNDLIEMKKADLSGVKYLVLDEADRMLGKCCHKIRLGITGLSTIYFDQIWASNLKFVAL